jgi:hypothetical protein
MGKSPAFQFYPMDFLSDEKVRKMDYEQVGWYIVLLCHCWIEGSVPSDPIDALKLLKVNENTMESSNTLNVDVMAQLLANCFVSYGLATGRLYNKRLDAIRKEQEERKKERSDSGKIGAKVRWIDDKKHKKQSIAQPSFKNGIAIGLPLAKNGSSSSSSSSSSNSNIYTPKKISKKSKFAKLQNVLLTQEEFEKLKNRFNGHDNAMVWVEKMSIGIAMKGYKYKSHYLAILKWAENENPTEKLDSFKKPTEHIINYKELPVVVKGGL